MDLAESERDHYELEVPANDAASRDNESSG
jgi:hypothetical protein